MNKSTAFLIALLISTPTLAGGHFEINAGADYTKIDAGVDTDNLRHNVSLNVTGERVINRTNFDDGYQIKSELQENVATAQYEYTVNKALSFGTQIQQHNNLQDKRPAGSRKNGSVFVRFNF